MAVSVPQEFVALGFTGLFHQEAAMNMTAAEVEEWRRRVPCLLDRYRGWMALEVLPGSPPRMVLVRTDAGAIVDLMFRNQVIYPTGDDLESGE